MQTIGEVSLTHLLGHSLLHVERQEWISFHQTFPREGHAVADLARFIL